MEEKKTVFISYSREDFDLARKLYNDLEKSGVRPWMDEMDLLAGQNWHVAINQAIKKSSFFLVLLSSHSVSKRGSVQKELKLALDILDEYPRDEIFIIPVRVDNCELIDERLQYLHSVDLFYSYKDGLKNILRVLESPSHKTLRAVSHFPVRGDRKSKPTSPVKVKKISSRTMASFASLFFIVGICLFYYLLNAPPAEFYNERGLNNYLAGQLNNAQQDYIRAIKLNPNLAEAHYNLGILYEDIHDFKKAHTEYKEAVKYGLDAAYNNLARLYILEKNYSAAVDFLHNSLSLAQDDDVKYDMLLKYADEEVRAIGRLYEINPLIGKEATETRVKTDVLNARILHIAAHGKFNKENPLFSRIGLTPDDKNDGLLEAYEIYQLDMTQTDLVVLSASESQIGAVTAGDEVMSLSRAFMYAGSPSVIASLWRVDDRSATDLMVSFYKHLRSGTSRAEALRQAQLHVRSKYPSPYYWAPFVLTGAYGPIGDS